MTLSLVSWLRHLQQHVSGLVLLGSCKMPRIVIVISDQSQKVCCNTKKKNVFPLLALVALSYGQCVFQQ